jgi:hypothetical protein
MDDEQIPIPAVKQRPQLSHFAYFCQLSEVSSLKLIISFHAYPCFSLFRYIHCRTLCVGEFRAVIDVCVLGF